MSNMGDVLIALKSVLNELVISGDIKTVVRVYSQEFDITQYAKADLPLIAIPEPVEDTDEECTSQMSMMALGAKLLVYFLDWAMDPDATKYELLKKKIRDKIGANFNLNGAAEECRVADISLVLGTMPVYNFIIDLEMKYYMSEKNV